MAAHSGRGQRRGRGQACHIPSWGCTPHCSPLSRTPPPPAVPPPNRACHKILKFFSYEHFYVIYCKFWELDTDHDFLLSKEDLLHYANCALSYLIVDRIFDEVTPLISSARRTPARHADALHAPHVRMHGFGFGRGWASGTHDRAPEARRALAGFAADGCWRCRGSGVSPPSGPLPASQAPRKFKAGTPAGKMGYEDFVWFILSEEDKSTDTALTYWFR
jgi:hypothetical protein